MEAYLVETAKVLTTSEEELQNEGIDPEKEKKVEKLISSALYLALPIFPSADPVAAATVGLAGGLVGLIVPSIKKTLERLRYTRAENARVKLEEAIRREFGVPTTPAAAPLTKGSEESS